LSLPSRISNEEIVAQLESGGLPFVELLSDNSVAVERYAPRGIDPQTPHDRDELYLIVAGAATFEVEGERMPARPGDLIFVAARKEHRFVDISVDFDTWVIFFGPRTS
jgi:mannose-6-phosphate isomerase-like protein (cupin superfamily)